VSFGRAPAPGTGSRAGRSYAFTSLTPVVAGRSHSLAAHLRDLPIGRDSPLASLEYVHLGRWMVIDRLKVDWPGAPRRPTRLRSDYLLFTASMTAPDDANAAQFPDCFLRELAAKVPAQVDAIWRHCVGYPGVASVETFLEYLGKSQLDTVLFHVGYPNATVQHVHDALAARDGLVGFVRRHQHETDPAVLQRAYIEESSTWSF